MRLAAAAPLALSVVFGACAADPATDPQPAPLDPISVAFPAIDVDAGGELSELCQSATLHNDEPLYINTVQMSSGPAWHHSNWFFVPEDSFAGDDGTWPCGDRDFDSVQAALVGGVLYAQSTQATAEAQAFEPGAAVYVPPHSKLIGDVHLLNASDSAVHTAMNLELDLLHEDEVDTILTPLELHYFPLRLPPKQRSSFGSECDYEAAYGGAVDFSIHYVMPHYHNLGVGMRIELFGGDRDGELVFESDSPVGTPMGGTLDHPLSMAGARGLRFSCTYDNPRDQAVGWGIGDQEMCVALVFTDSDVMWAGGVEDSRESLGDAPDGTAEFGGPCTLYTLRARN